MRLRFKLGDIVIILTIILAAVFMTASLYQENTIAKTAVITQNNIVLKRIPLDRLTEKVTLDYSGPYPGVIEAENGKIRFSHAECPDQVCVNTGWITRPGQIAVCLPAGIVVKIEGEDSEIDLMVK